MECRKASKGEISFVMTSSTYMNINKMITTVRKCKNNKEDKEKIIGELMQNAVNGLRRGSPPTPKLYYFYRRGGNYVQNRKIAENEVPMFINILTKMKNTVENFKKTDLKFIYVCFNLKRDLKFFEK